MCKILGASIVSANLYCNSRTSVLGKLRDYLRLLMWRTLFHLRIVILVMDILYFQTEILRRTKPHKLIICSNFRDYIFFLDIKMINGSGLNSNLSRFRVAKKICFSVTDLMLIIINIFFKNRSN